MTTTPPPPAPSGAAAPARDASPSTRTDKHAQPHRMPPSLNQLAARITASGTNPVSSSNQSTSRPRLAAQLLRTGSQVSLTSSVAASVADSTVVNPPSTRSISPDSSSRASSPPGFVQNAANGTGVGDGSGPGEPLTAEKLEKLGSVDGEKKVKVGYKNIPSLDAITARLAMARSLSIDGSPKPPEPETFEDPATPGIPQRKKEHPLQHSWYV